MKVFCEVDDACKPSRDEYLYMFIYKRHTRDSSFRLHRADGNSSCNCPPWSSSFSSSSLHPHPPLSQASKTLEARIQKHAHCSIFPPLSLCLILEFLLSSSGFVSPFQSNSTQLFLGCSIAMWALVHTVAKVPYIKSQHWSIFPLVAVLKESMFPILAELWGLSERGTLCLQPRRNSHHSEMKMIAVSLLLPIFIWRTSLQAHQLNPFLATVC